ncbi:MAG: hypothetical protein M0Z61_03655 [Nitrospiraceae bacterium]|nr:hypothetical protein [Nitrospiraceae bacterium]
MTKPKKKVKAMRRSPKVKPREKKTYLDITDDIDSQMVYLLEIAGLLRFLFEGKTTAKIPLSNVLNDLYDRLEWLKGSIEELKGFCRE